MNKYKKILISLILCVVIFSFIGCGNRLKINYTSSPKSNIDVPIVTNKQTNSSQDSKEQEELRKQEELKKQEALEKQKTGEIEAQRQSILTQINQLYS